MILQIVARAQDLPPCPRSGSGAQYGNYGYISVKPLKVAQNSKNGLEISSARPHCIRAVRLRPLPGRGRAGAGRRAGLGGLRRCGCGGQRWVAGAWGRRALRAGLAGRGGEDGPCPAAGAAGCRHSARPGPWSSTRSVRSGARLPGPGPPGGIGLLAAGRAAASPDPSLPSLDTGPARGSIRLIHAAAVAAAATTAPSPPTAIFAAIALGRLDIAASAPLA